MRRAGLMKTGTEEELAKLEEMILLAPQEGLAIALEIVKRKKEGAATFLAAFKTGLKADLEDLCFRYQYFSDCLK